MNESARQAYQRPDLSKAPPVIEVKNLVTHYGRRKILNSVSLQVREGEVFLALGDRKLGLLLPVLEAEPGLGQATLQLLPVGDRLDEPELVP